MANRLKSNGSRLDDLDAVLIAGALGRNGGCDTQRSKERTRPAPG